MPSDEDKFMGFYAHYASVGDLNPDPDNPEHYYDYRAWWKAMGKPDNVYQALKSGDYAPEYDGEDKSLHGPSEFKASDHPRRYVKVEGKWLDTKNEEYVDDETVLQWANK
jgi:hypothetical protein